jgi:hypothetical protein
MTFLMTQNPLLKGLIRTKSIKYDLFINDTMSQSHFNTSNGVCTVHMVAVSFLVLVGNNASSDALRAVWFGFGLVGFSFNASLGPNEGPERGAALRKPLLLTTLFGLVG